MGPSFTRGLFNYHVWWGEKDPRGSTPSPPSVSLTRKPQHALFILVPISLLVHSHTFCMPKSEKAKQVRSTYKKPRTKHVCQQQRLTWRTQRGEERGRDVVKDREARRNWPNAKIIQARSEINPRAWKLWINVLLSCSQEKQNKMCKRAGTHEACILRASCEQC